MNTQRNDEQIREEVTSAIASIISEELPPDKAFWLTFEDEDDFLGALFIHANTFLEALVRVYLLNIHPRANCKGFPIPAAVAAKIPDCWKNRVLTGDECDHLERQVGGILKWRS